MQRSALEFVGSCPRHGLRIQNDELPVLYHLALGLAPPSLRAHAGKALSWTTKGGTKRTIVLDAEGHVASCAHLPGDDFRTAHTTVQRAITQLLRWLGIESTEEAATIFASFAGRRGDFRGLRPP